MTQTAENADLLARTAHRGQVDKAGQPYINHVRAVAEMLVPYGPDAVMAGLLHDVVEDTHVGLFPHADGTPCVLDRPGEAG